MDKVLVTGVAGGQGNLVARRLARAYEIVGADRTPWKERPRELRFYQLDLRKRRFEDVVRRERPHAIAHLAFIRHFEEAPAVRHQVNLAGTKRVLECCVTYGVKQLVVFSSAYVYGALPENPYYMDEGYPLNGSRTYPDVRDLVEVDTLASAYLWQYPEIAVTIIRPVNVLGYSVHSAIGRYLQLEYVPTAMGFNPMMQFIHEQDVAEAIALAIERRARGVFNLTGPGAVPLKVAIAETGGTAVPLPEVLARPAVRTMFRLGLYPFPPGAIDFVKYPCTLDGSRFAAATGFKPRFGLEEIFASLRS
ncbi:MAG: NAD-dependent epimerase/dehydratase family protein [Deltaproteobacteria bacterium]|nr:NAD-dependent epimerase/dehydratase family protein [Deltaproteobacteria bacterium]